MIEAGLLYGCFHSAIKRDYIYIFNRVLYIYKYIIYL